MSHRTDPSHLASSAMTAPPSDDYYHEDATRHIHADQRQYEQTQSHTHQFQARMSASSLAHPTESSTDGGVFYPPSNFAAARMSAHQFSAAPVSASAYQSQADYTESDAHEPSTTSTSAYYSSGGDESHSQYLPPPMSSLQPGMHTSTQAHEDAVSESATIPTYSSAPATGYVQAGGPPSPTNLAARRHSTSDIGRWKTFATGPFAGRTVRADVVEVQKADLGRKCADPPTSTSHGGEGEGSRKGKERNDKDRVGNGEKEKEKEKEKDGERAVRKDRRPLDPPPVVSLHLYESVNHGTPQQFERAIPAEEVEIGGLICQVDLYRVTIPPSPTEVASLTLHVGTASGTGHGQMFQQGSQHGILAHSTPLQLQPHPHHTNHHPSQSPYDQHAFPYPPSAQRAAGTGLLSTEEEGVNDRSPLDAGWESPSPVSPVSPYAYHRQPPHMSGHPLTSTLSTQIPTLHTLNSPSVGAPIDPDALPPPSESDKLTRVLFGESYAHACSILDLSGRPALYFVFADLSVKLEGLFRPRYRFFDLFSRTGDSADVPVLAQCFGGAFAVYSTKEFPGLKASTPLTKHLSRWGIRVNIRETERKRRAPETTGSISSSGAGQKDKRRGGNGRKRGGSVAGASSGASVRGEDEADDTETTRIPRGVDAPRRYLEGTVRGRGGRTRTSTGGPSTGTSASTNVREAEGRGRK